MIRITVELVPFGIEERKRIIGTAKIYNDGTGSKTVGNYQTEFNLKKKWRTGTVKGFKRQQDNVWKLIREALNNI